MALILSIETATTVCSVAITLGDQILIERKLFTERSHANELTLLIQELASSAGVSISDFKAVAVSKGPGSYTGLRIGISTAKGLCYALGVPLIGINSLKAMAFEVQQKYDTMDCFCPMIDARRMEVYTAVYNQDLTEIVKTHPLVLNELSFQETLNKKAMLFFGNGSDKFENLVTSSNGKFVKDITPSAWAVGLLAQDKFIKNEFEDLAYFEPSYLKEFQATTPKALL